MPKDCYSFSFFLFIFFNESGQKGFLPRCPLFVLFFLKIGAFLTFPLFVKFRIDFGKTASFDFCDFLFFSFSVSIFCVYIILRRPGRLAGCSCRGDFAISRWGVIDGGSIDRG